MSQALPTHSSDEKYCVHRLYSDSMPVEALPADLRIPVAVDAQDKNMQSFPCSFLTTSRHPLWLQGFPDTAQQRILTNP